MTPCAWAPRPARWPAGRLAGDDLTLSLHLLPGARASLVATGASIAQGANHRRASDRRRLGSACRSLVVLGRAGEQPGAARLRWDVTVAGRPLLRQHLDLTDPKLRTWPGMLGEARVLGSALLAGPELQARTVVSTASAVAQRLDERAVLVTVLGTDAADTERQLTDLCDRVIAGDPGAPGS